MAVSKMSLAVLLVVASVAQMAAAIAVPAQPLTARLNLDALKKQSNSRAQNARLSKSAYGGFDLNVAFTALNYATAAYCKGSIANWSCKPCQKLPDTTNIQTYYAKKTDTFGYSGFAGSTKQLIVAFEGSHDIQQFIDDAEFLKKPLNFPGAASDVEVHTGFLDSYLAIQSELIQRVNATIASEPDVEILVAGHSLGAAIAAICALDLNILHPTIPINLYTFGLPRVGNAQFVQFFKAQNIQNYYRFVHNKDIVPHLPMESLNYRHIPTEVYYKEDYNGPSSLTICNGSGEDPNCSDGNLVDLSVSDHLNYLGQSVSSDAC
eukprot:m.354300 g.354300  ORF g.354300 m.354300 type:complete len:321 (+) comp16974_c0_seq1:132-1094(+)